MAKPYPNELRTRVVKAYQSGEGSLAEIAARFSLGEATVKRWLWLQRDKGDPSPPTWTPGPQAKVSRSDVDALVDRMGDANAGELTAEFNRHHRGSSRIHESSMKRALRRAGYVVKKNVGARSSSSAPTSS